MLSKQNQFARSLVTQMQQLPGVKGAALASRPAASDLGSVSIHIKGQQESRSNERHTAADVVVTSDYFQVVGVSMLSGRAFTDRDDATAPRVVLVNQEFVHKYFQDHDPVGKQIQLDIADAPSAWSEIVGVVGNVKSYSEDPRMEPQVYEFYVQRPVASFSVMLRSTVDPSQSRACSAPRRCTARLRTPTPAGDEHGRRD